MMSKNPVVSTACILLFALCLNGCGGEQQTTTGEQQTRSGEQVGKVEGGPSGTVTIDGQVYTMDRFVQCSVFQQDTVNVFGTAEGNEITLDVFSQDSAQLTLVIDGQELHGDAKDPQISVEGATISGTATLGSLMGGEQVKADFEFRCR